MSASSTIRVRFAPSPTGYLHVGGARTALFNWLYARKHGGTLILRIEDTDLERSTAEMVDGILEGMRWMGLDWDEGPFFQSERMEMYRAAAARLVESGHAYYCFCSKDLLEKRRAAAQAEGRSPTYEGTCRRIAPEEAHRRRDAGEPCAVRFAVPQGGSTSFDDAVCERVEFANSQIEDFVLLRSDGVPTYHLSVVVDDLDMRITHVIRGADHISNTPKQVLLYGAFGAPLPAFAHVPLILGPDKTRLSKRHGATSVMAYRDDGILPEAFRNFLALLGWSPPDSSREILSDRELIELFSLEGIARSNAVFDRTKLEWFNAEYIRALPVDDLSERLLPIVRAAGHAVDLESMRRITPLIRERIKLLRDVLTAADFFLMEQLPPYDVAQLAPQKGDLAMARKVLERSREVLAQTEFDHQAIDQALRAAAQELGLKPGQMFQPIRVAVCGRNAAPPLFETLEVLGREKALMRIDQALGRIRQSSGVATIES
ncbi:MAG: glutamate--tRNA ligase [Terriglobales bacterium]